MEKELADAIKRLDKWANPHASGEPTKRMTKIWPAPIFLLKDLRLVLDEVKSSGRYPNKPIQLPI